jgi:alpha-glucosidase
MSRQEGSRITLQSVEGSIIEIFVLEEDILRVIVLPFGKLRFPRTWAIAPGLEDIPLEGRDRFSLDGFSLPPVQLEEESNQLRITTSRVRLTVNLEGFFCRWEVKQNGRWMFAASDRSTQSYNFGLWDERVYHI